MELTFPRSSSDPTQFQRRAPPLQLGNSNTSSHDPFQLAQQRGARDPFERLAVTEAGRAWQDARLIHCSYSYLP